MTSRIILFIKDEEIDKYCSDDIPRVGDIIDLDTRTVTHGRMLLKVEAIVRFIPGNDIHIRCIKI